MTLRVEINCCCGLIFSSYDSFLFKACNAIQCIGFPLLTKEATCVEVAFIHFELSIRDNVNMMRREKIYSCGDVTYHMVEVQDMIIICYISYDGGASYDYYTLDIIWWWWCKI